MHKRILIIDDDEISRTTLGEIFKAEPTWEIVEASNGQDALDRLCDGLRPDLCLVDLVMPEVGGIELIRRIRRDPTVAIGALEVIEETGRASLAELRRILDVLRDGESPELVPQPSITRIGELASSDGALPVEIAMHGSARELRPTVDVSAYRIVQEALTNVRKHAGPRAKASVDIDFGAETLTVRVNDDGRGAMTLVEPRTRPGHGIVGMRERVAVCGGTLHTGPRDGGGWSVTASLPYEEPT